MIKYEAIDEKTFIKRFVTPYASYMCYDNGKYWHKNRPNFFDYYPVFNFNVNVGSSHKLEKPHDVQQLPDWEVENRSFLIALDGQERGEPGHYLYIGFGYLHAGRYILYPVGPIGINYRDGVFPDTTIDLGFDNCIPMPLQIKHCYSDGFYRSNSFRAMHYYRGVLQKRETGDGRFWYYRDGQLHKYEDKNSEIKLENGFVTRNIKYSQFKEIIGVSDFYHGERHGDMIYENCRARLDNGYLYGPFAYESDNWRSSGFPAPHESKLEGKVSVTGSFRPGVVYISYNNLWDNYPGTIDCDVGFVKGNNITLSPSHCLGSLKLSINGIERASFYLNADGQFHGPQQPLLGAKIVYYWNGAEYTSDEYNKVIAMIERYTSIPKELINIIVLYS